MLASHPHGILPFVLSMLVDKGNIVLVHVTNLTVLPGRLKCPYCSPTELCMEAFLRTLCCAVLCFSHRYSMITAMGYLTVCQVSRVFIFNYGILSTDFSG